MKEKWTYKKLGEVCDEALSFKWIDGVEKTYIDLTSVNRETHTIVDPIVVDSKNAPSRAKQIVKGGDILFGTTRPMMKRVCVIEDAFDEQICSTGFCVLRPEQNVLTRWIFYNLLSNSFYSYIEPLQNGVAYPAVSNKEVRDFSIPVPPIETQSRIVSELDLLQSIIDKQKAQLKELDNLAQAVFYDMFGDPVENDKGWEVKKLGEICDITSSKRIFADEYVDKGVPFYRSKEVIERSKGLPISVELFISEERYKDVKEKYGVPELGDILITAVGTIGKIWSINTEAPFYFKDGNLVWLRKINKEIIDSTFFRASLVLLVEDYKDVNANGAAYNALTIIKLKEMRCVLPPLSLQQSFAEKIEDIEQQKARISQSIAETQRLFDYTMDKYFG